MRTTYVDNCVVHSHTLYFHTYVIRHAQFTHTHTHSLLTHINSHSVVTYIHSSLFTHSYIYTYFLFTHTHTWLYTLFTRTHTHSVLTKTLTLYLHIYIHTMYSLIHTHSLYSHTCTLSYTRFLLHSKAHLFLSLTHIFLSLINLFAHAHIHHREREKGADVHHLGNVLLFQFHRHHSFSPRYYLFAITVLWYSCPWLHDVNNLSNQTVSELLTSFSAAVTLKKTSCSISHAHHLLSARKAPL